jgi:hypothetical protein
VITFPGAIKLAMFLPGKSAKKNRSLMANILVRYFAGDPTLIHEIEANAESDDPVANMARAALPVIADDHVGLKLKRKREELEFVKSGIEFYASIGTNNALDERGAVVFKDAVLGLHTRDLLEIENIRIQQTKEKLQMEREHVNGMFDIENKKRIAENAHSREALEIEQQQQAGARAHAKEMMRAEQENLKTILNIENERRAAERDHAMEMLGIANQKPSLDEKEEVTEQWILRDIPEIDRRDMTLGRVYVTSLLRDKVKPWMIEVNFASLKYRLRRYHPKIQVIRRNHRIFFKNEDLPAIKTILFEKLHTSETTRFAVK